MGCDIHTFVEIRREGRWRVADVSAQPWGESDRHDEPEPFSTRLYGVFGFLADVRNLSKVPPLALPRGLPVDVSAEVKTTLENEDYHSHSWLTVAELASFDYEQSFTNQREQPHTPVSYKTFLGSLYFKDLEILKSLGDWPQTRIVFAFDS